MNKKQLSLALLSMIALTNNSWGTDKYHHDSNLVGPGHYARETKKENQQVIEAIQKKNADTLKTDVTQANLDKFFCHPTQGTGFTKEIFASFKGTRGENEVIAQAQKMLPEGKLLAVHKFEGDKTEEGTPVQMIIKSTVNKDTVQEYEALTTVIAQQSGFKITFKQSVNLKTGEKPKISLKEEAIKEGEEVDLPEITNGMMNVAIYSGERDIPTSTGSTSAIRQKFNLPANHF